MLNPEGVPVKAIHFRLDLMLFLFESVKTAAVEMADKTAAAETTD